MNFPLRAFAYSLGSIGLASLLGLSACDSGSSTNTPLNSGGSGGASGGQTASGGSSNGGSAASGGGSASGGGATGGQGNTETFLAVGMGSWASSGQGSVALYRMNDETQGFELKDSLDLGDLESYGVFSHDGSRLFVADEAGQSLRCLEIDYASSELSELDEKSVDGGPVYLSLDAPGTHLLVAYYNQGRVDVFPIDAACKIGELTDSETTGQYAHSIVLSPDGNFAYVSNKGANTISQFSYDEDTGELEALTPTEIARAGGPRHFTFATSGDFAYGVNETASTVTAFSVTSGALSELTTVSNVTPGFAGTLSGAHIALSRDGKNLFSANRSEGQSTINSFPLEEDGTPGALRSVSSEGSTPRNFAVHPTKDYLVVANQDSNSLVPFRIAADGSLTAGTPVSTTENPFWVGFWVVSD